MYYENIVLESGSPGKVKGSCDRTRVTSRLPRNYLDLYTGKAQRDWAGVKTIDGKVPQGVLDLLAGKRGPQYVAGTFQGTPTIIAVVVGDPTDVPAPCEITPIITKHPSEPNKGTQESTQYGEDGGLPTLGAPMPEKSVSPPDPTDLPDPGDSFGGGEESSTTSFKRPSLAKPETTRRGEDGDELPTPVGPTPQVSSGKMNAVVTPSPDVPNVGSVILSILNSNPPTPRGGGANSQPQVTGPAQRPTPVIKFKGSTITANTQSNFIVGGQTLAPGSAITVDNTPISLAPEPTAVFIGGSSFAVNNVPAPTAAPSITFGGSVITASNSQFVIEGQTLTPGGAITVSGTAVSLGDSGSTLVVGSSTFAVGGTMAPVFSVGDTEYTASASTFVVQGQTLTPGGSVTIGGTVYSLQPGGTAVVIGGTSTVSLSSVAVATTTADDAIATAAGTQNSGLRIKSGLGLLASLLVMALSVIS